MRLYITLLATALTLFVASTTMAQVDTLATPAQQAVSPSDGVDQQAMTSSEGVDQQAPVSVLATVDQLWDQANTAYINGNYNNAVQCYELILERGVGSSKLYYNLANAYFKEQRIGKAILFYKRALRFSPGNEDMRYNLQVAEARTKDNIEAIPEFFLSVWLVDLRHMMGCAAWSLFSLGALICMLSLFLFYLLAQRLTLRKVGFYGTLLSAIVFTLATWSAVGERREILDESHAVIISSSVAVKSSPDKAATDLFILHEGTTVHIASRLGDWCEVVIADGKKGWLDVRQIEVI